MTTAILIVDDDPLLRSVIAEFLSDSGFAVLEAQDANEALHLLRTRAGEVAVLLTDICMPGPVDGLELARMAQRNWPWLRVVITSGEQSPVAGDASYFLPKPWQMRDLVGHVANAVRDFNAFQLIWASA